MNLYKEEDYYKDKGWPAEEYLYCNFTLPVDSVSEYYKLKCCQDYIEFIMSISMTIDKSLINRLFDQAVVNPRLRIIYDLRNSETDGSQRMLREERVG